MPDAEMRALITAMVLAALVAPAANAATTGPLEWPDAPPADVPFAESTRWSGIAFTGPYYNQQPISDTWYPSWGADGNLYSPYMDGFCNGVGTFGGYGASPAFVGYAVISGSDPGNLSFRCLSRPVERNPYDGRYASASLHYKGVWYYGSYTLNTQPPEGMEDCRNYCTLGPFVGFDTSTDGGLTWQNSPHTPTEPLFGESPEGGQRVKMGALHVADFGKDMEHSPDGKMYLVGHGGGGPRSQNTWINADNVYLARVKPTPETVNDESAYEYYAGDGRWTDDFAQIEPLLSWPNGRLGSATITYLEQLDTYLMFTSAPTDGVNGRGRYDTMVLEANSITGPYRLVHYLRHFGPQAYFVNVPTRFVSPDASRMYLSYSANYANDDDPGGTSNPEGSGYSWVLREFTLKGVGAPASPPSADCRDRRRPRVAIRQVAVGRERVRVSGRARDRGCAGLARVDVALRRAGRAPRRWTARGTRRWSLRTRVVTRRGRYAVRARAIDRAGNAGVSRARRVRVR